MSLEAQCPSGVSHQRTGDPTSPSLQWVAWISLPHLQWYYARLRLPNVLLDTLCSRSVIDTLFVPSVRVPFPARLRSGNLALTPGLLGHPVRLFRVVDKETFGSPKFPDYPLELMPCS